MNESLQPLLTAVAVLGGIAGVSALVLGIAGRFFSVSEDPRTSAVEAALPGANCGACGFPGCSGYARDIVENNADTNLCAPGRKNSAEKIAAIMGREAGATQARVARLRCHGHTEACLPRYHYEGVATCRAASLLNTSLKACAYGCQGFGDCVRVCRFNAMRMENGLPVIDEALCTGCGLCIKACPKDLLRLEQKQRKVFLHCASADPGKEVRKVCKTGCIACGLCAKKCPENALTMTGNLPVWDWAKCTSCGICAEVCPRDIIFFEGRPGKPGSASSLSPETADA